MEVLVLAVLLIAVSLFLVKLWNSHAEEEMERTKEAIAPAVDNISSKLEKMGFTETSEVYVKYPVKQIKVDSHSKRVAICNYDNNSLTCLNFKDILDCELTEDHNVICSSGIGRAVVGGIVAGEVGAIVGSNTAKSKEYVNSLTVRIFTSDIDHPQIVIEMLPYRMEKSYYRFYLEGAREVYAIFNSIVLANRTSIG